MKKKSLVASLFVCFLLAPATSVASPAKLRTTCNGCSDLQMAEAAANLGEGEHLVFNVTGQTFRKYEVFCVGSGGGSGGGHVRSSTRSWCSGVLNPVEQVPTSFDFSAFAQISDALASDGSIRKNVALTVTSPASAYDLGQAGDVGVIARIDLQDGLWPQVAARMGWVPAIGVRWVSEYTPFPIVPNPNPNEIVVAITFSDESTMTAVIDITRLLSFNPVPPVVTLDLDSARDKEGRRIPGLNYPLPSATNEVVRYPSNTSGFETLMRGHGFTIRNHFPGVHGGGGTRYQCSLRMIDENNPAAGSETVCLRAD
jgi:hypothetical protein